MTTRPFAVLLAATLAFPAAAETREPVKPIHVSASVDDVSAAQPVRKMTRAEKRALAKAQAEAEADAVAQVRAAGKESEAIGTLGQSRPSVKEMFNEVFATEDWRIAEQRGEVGV